jgi:hypothetical protein
VDSDVTVDDLVERITSASRPISLNFRKVSGE